VPAADLLEEKVVANVTVVVSAFGFGDKQFSVDVGGNVKIVVVSAGAQPHLQDAVLREIADPG
jgi:hypothetical protein